jgi:hypothetical protein
MNILVGRWRWFKFEKVTEKDPNYPYPNFGRGEYIPAKFKMGDLEPRHSFISYGWQKDQKLLSVRSIFWIFEKLLKKSRVLLNHSFSFFYFPKKVHLLSHDTSGWWQATRSETKQMNEGERGWKMDRHSTNLCRTWYSFYIGFSKDFDSPLIFSSPSMEILLDIFFSLALGLSNLFFVTDNPCCAPPTEKISSIGTREFERDSDEWIRWYQAGQIKEESSVEKKNECLFPITSHSHKI